MDETNRATCPFCAEPLDGTASCNACGGPKPARPRPVYRDQPGSQIAGVSVALAEAFGVSVTLVRVAFVVLTVTSFVGPLIYGALWILIPLTPADDWVPAPPGALHAGEPSIAERLVDWARDLSERVADWFRTTESTTPPSEPPTPAGGAS